MSGFLSLANSIIRNNKRKRINKFDRIEPYIVVESSSKPTYKKASQHLLHKIKRRMQQENRQLHRKTIVVFSIVGCILATLMYYFLFVYQV
ncbi:hypothetical protein [Kordia sp.]|uniref:hypothetical protein n=1 Tax=Kordia sp. TaxID=1965332 RepID=UPI0025BEDCDE|nr:hypothetical protein [Kordia sp.]MCH2196864.1 hypothetical protein [Kordia sp.]